jgi:hypothetical protein
VKPASFFVSLLNSQAMTQSKYYCEVYKYDQDGRNLVHRATVGNIQAYTKQLNIKNTGWDEFEIWTKPDTMKILAGIDGSRFLGKVVNCESSYITIKEG